MLHMLLSASESLLLVIDIQDRLLPVMHEAERVVRQTGILLQAAARLQIPVLLTEQYPKGLGPTAPEIRAAAGDSAILEKLHFSAWSEAAVRERIASIDRPQVVIAGIEAHVCVLQTALELAGAGRKVMVVTDAISSRHPDSAAVAKDRMAAAGIGLVTTEMCLFEWLGSAAHPEFKTLSRLIK